MCVASMAEIEATLDGSLEREVQSKGSWRFVLTPAPEISKPAEHVCTEAPAVQVPLQSFHSWKRKSCAMFPVQNDSTLPGRASQD